MAYSKFHCFSVPSRFVVTAVFCIVSIRLDLRYQVVLMKDCIGEALWATACPVFRCFSASIFGVESYALDSGYTIEIPGRPLDGVPFLFKTVLVFGTDLGKKRSKPSLRTIIGNLKKKTQEVEFLSQIIPITVNILLTLCIFIMYIMITHMNKLCSV